MDFKIRFVKENEIDIVKDLYCLCFGSDKGEADMFFRPRQKSIIGAFDSDTLCSIMTVFDSEAVLSNRTVRAGYIAGVATDPTYRGNKLFQRCFDFYCETEHGKEMLFCIPATPSLFNLYKSAGLNQTTYIKQAYFTGCGDKTDIDSDSKTGDIIDNRSLIIKKPPELSAATADVFMYYGGKVIEGEGYAAFVYENKNEVTVADICTTKYSDAISKILKRIAEGKKVRFVLPDNYYTDDIEGERMPIAVCKLLNDNLDIDGIYINMLFNDI